MGRNNNNSNKMANKVGETSALQIHSPGGSTRAKVPLLTGVRDPHLTQCVTDQCQPLYKAATQRVQPFCHNTSTCPTDDQPTNDIATTYTDTNQQHYIVHSTYPCIVNVLPDCSFYY